MKNMSYQKDFIDVVCSELTNKKISTTNKNILIRFCENFLEFHDDELEPPSSMISLLTSSCGNKYPQVISNTINCFGFKHFCFEDMAKFLIDDYENYKIWPGFGHPKYKNEDPRVKSCLDFMNGVQYQGFYVSKILSLQSKTKHPLNIGGLFTAFLLDVGFTEKNISYFPIIIRCIGITKIYQKSNNIKFQSSYEVIKEFNSTHCN